MRGTGLQHCIVFFLLHLLKLTLIDSVGVFIFGNFVLIRNHVRVIMILSSYCIIRFDNEAEHESLAFHLENILMCFTASVTFVF